MANNAIERIFSTVIIIATASACSGGGYFKKNYQNAVGEKYLDRRKINDNLFIENGGYKIKTQDPFTTPPSKSSDGSVASRYAMLEHGLRRPEMNQRMLSGSMESEGAAMEQGSADYDDGEEDAAEAIQMMTPIITTEEYKAIEQINYPAASISVGSSGDRPLNDKGEISKKMTTQNAGAAATAPGIQRLAPHSHDTARPRVLPSASTDVITKMSSQEKFVSAHTSHSSPAISVADHTRGSKILSPREAKTAAKFMLKVDPMTIQRTEPIGKTTPLSDAVDSLIDGDIATDTGSGRSLMAQLGNGLARIRHFSAMLYSSHYTQSEADMPQSEEFVIPEITDKQIHSPGEPLQLYDFPATPDFNRVV